MGSKEEGDGVDWGGCQGGEVDLETTATGPTEERVVPQWGGHTPGAWREGFGGDVGGRREGVDGVEKLDEGRGEAEAVSRDRPPEQHP